MASLANRVKKLSEIENIQSLPGNYDANPYMHGMANGLILALSIMEDREPVFLTISSAEPSPKID